MFSKSTSAFIAFFLAALAVTGCVKSGPDYTPIGDGMKAMGICLVVCSVVAALADLMKAKPPPDGSSERARPRKGVNRKEEGK